MNTEQYVKKLKNILGEEEYNILFDKIFDEAKKKFEQKSNEEQLKNIVKVNLAAIIVFAMEIIKGHSKKEIKENFYRYDVGPRMVLVEKCTGRFLNKFNDYIDKVIVYTKENL